MKTMSKFKPGQRVIIKPGMPTNEEFWNQTAVLQENFGKTKWWLVFDNPIFKQFRYNSEEHTLIALEDGNDILKGML